jgi:CRISPR-associated protein Cas2
MTSDRVHRYIMAYDVASDTRRTRVAKTLESYGDRVQYSVFVVDTKPAKMLRLKAAITSCVDLATDSLMVCDLGPLADCGSRRIQFIGSPRMITSHGPLVL